MKQISTLKNQIEHFTGVLGSSQTSINHMIAFATICENQPITSHDLHLKLGFEQSTTNRLLHALAQNNRGTGLGAEVIEINMIKEDKRQREIKLTEKGNDLKKKMFGSKK